MPTKDADKQYTYTFAGWNTAEDGSGEAWTSDTTATGSVTYYAQYAKTLNKYTITWVNHGEVVKTEEKEYGNDVSWHNLSRTGYQLGWNTKEDGTGDKFVSAPITDHITYYAQWTIPVWVGGEPFAEDKLTINGNQGGTATYAPENRTLTLNNFKWEGAVNPASGAASNMTTSAVIEFGYYGTNVTVVLEGDSVITNTYEDESSFVVGLDSGRNNLTIRDGDGEGVGSLIATGGPGYCSAGILTGYDLGTLTFESGNITAQANSAAAMGYGICIREGDKLREFNINGGSVTAIAIPETTAENQSWGTGIGGPVSGVNVSMKQGSRLFCKGGIYACEFGLSVPYKSNCISYENYDGTGEKIVHETDTSSYVPNSESREWIQVIAEYITGST